MEKWSDAIKKMLSKKYVANLLVLIAAAIMVLIISGDLRSNPSPSKNINNNPMGDTLVKEVVEYKTEEDMVEARLKRILESIRGAGTVEVMITFEMGSEIVPALNTTISTDTSEEMDSNGGTRVVTSNSTTETIATTNDNSGNKPLVIKEIKPQINGVIVVAEGADDIEVKAKLYEAVKTVLQIPGHRVQIYPMN
ncbi:stage III sporulation protein AG [Alkaliphilus peptidifermentans]|uniref:Stage III sporulation protein AG n=1 Tax=Alkaliphilus peptidifermentans DSM 18978 TaxID=1120976 RepID=A0A1G5KEY8_9FIRM|nr:stage III sporulation protein AG [Alkaliphilus peptidifermentans]SCY98638.1 stage III sporulation protein AG [Alkaliphilus peptidifermentans DSM 18978]